MMWLLKRVFGLGVAVAIVYVVLQYPLGGRPVKDYVVDFYRSPLAQEAIRQTKLIVTRYLQKDVTRPAQEEDVAPMDSVSEEEREELEQVLKESR